ncbi:MAG: phosphoribosyltransferase [Chloroflexi bacterium]|nr:phosphoribosyltransferase [Chloroflexota bacterium]
MQAARREFLTWEDVEGLIDHLLPQFEGEFDTMLMVTRGGLIPGGLLAEAMGIANILIAAVDFPTELAMEKARLYAWPQFIQFPEENLLQGKRVLVVDDVWGSGRTITAVKNRVSAAGGFPYTCVLHFNPYRNLFGAAHPDYYAAITDAHIVYPWEIERGGSEKVLLDHPPFPPA